MEVVLPIHVLSTSTLQVSTAPGARNVIVIRIEGDISSCPFHQQPLIQHNPNQATNTCELRIIQFFRQESVFPEINGQKCCKEWIHDDSAVSEKEQGKHFMIIFYGRFSITSAPNKKKKRQK